jgi:hypothetical protein
MRDGSLRAPRYDPVTISSGDSSSDKERAAEDVGSDGLLS